MKEPDATFTALANILRRHASGLSIRTDESAHLYVEWPPSSPKAKPRFFGAVQVKKNYVSVHLMPVYEDPSLLEGTSDALRRKMQGKSCFNFTAVDPALFAELDALVGRCVAAV